MSPGQQLTHSRIPRPVPTPMQEPITTSFAVKEGLHHPKRGGATFPWALLGNAVGLEILRMGQTALQGPWVSSTAYSQGSWGSVAKESDMQGQHVRSHTTDL